MPGTPYYKMLPAALILRLRSFTRLGIAALDLVQRPRQSRRIATPPTSTVVLLFSIGLCTPLLAFSQQDPLTNPDAVRHRVDRSAMAIQIQGWSRDLRFPVYPIQVQAGSAGVYYVTKPSVPNYQEFDFEELRCEIGDANPAVLKLPGYRCADGVCMTGEGAILGTDPRRPVNKKHRC